VFLVIVQHPDKGWFCDHLGIIARGEDGAVQAVHSASPAVRREPLMTAVLRWRWIKGLAFLRLRDNAQELVDTELTHLDPSVVVVPPAQQDDKTRALRVVLDQERRAAQARPAAPAAQNGN
jgi:hypothetical protein